MDDLPAQAITVWVGQAPNAAVIIARRVMGQAQETHGPSERRNAFHRVLACLGVLSIAACAVGPDYKAPELPDKAGFTSAPLPARTTATNTPGGAAQGFVEGRDIPNDWWTVFRSKPLSDLIARALGANPNVEAAKATLRQAQENASASRSGMFPSLSAKASQTTVGFSAASIGQTYTEVFTLSTAMLSVSYPLDVFGGTRRQIEAADAQADYQRFQLEASYLTISSNIVVTAIQEASLRRQIAETEKIIESKRRILKLVQRQFDLGGASGSDVTTQAAALAQAEAGLPPLRRNLAQLRDQLNLLAGRFPNDTSLPTFDLEELSLPEELPVSLPSALLDQRPDIRSAAAQLRAATAQVGVAIANMLPQISLSGSYGRLTLGTLMQPGSIIWDYGASLSQPLFQGGKLLHQRRGADAGLEAAAAQYRATVLGAFQNVADALNTLQIDADAVAAQYAAERAAASNLAITEAQFRAGGTSFLALLNAQNAHAQAQIALIQVRANRYADTAALYQALGGGWWNRPPAPPEQKG